MQFQPTEASQRDGIHIDTCIEVGDAFAAVRTEARQMKAAARTLWQAAERIEQESVRAQTGTAQLTGIPYLSPTAA